MKECLPSSWQEEGPGMGVKACIAITDRTRSTPNSRIVPILLDLLNTSGMPDQNVTVISGGGMHAPDSRADLQRTVGQTVLDRVEVITNEPDNDAVMIKHGHDRHRHPGGGAPAFCRGGHQNRSHQRQSLYASRLVGQWQDRNARRFQPAQQNAEILAGITLAQFISSGTPVVYGSTSTNLDMKTGGLAIGSPELALVITATAQMARHYGLPCRSGGSLTDAHSPDARAGFEAMLSLLTTINSGVDFVLHSAGILSAYLAFSYEKFVLDDEMCGMMRRYRRGITVTPDTLAYDVIANVGSGGNFLMEEHTIKRCRSEFWQPAVCERGDLETWQTGGRPDVVVRARQRWQQLLAEHQDPPLDKATAHQLRAFVEEHAL